MKSTCIGGIIAALAWNVSLANAQLPHGLPATDNPAAQAVLEADMAEMLEWFEGRFDNDREVFFAESSGIPPEGRNGRIHSIFRRVDLPAFGEHVFYVEQYAGNDPANIYRQRIYTFSVDYQVNAIRLDIHAPHHPVSLRGAWRDASLLVGLTPADAVSYPGCEVYWRRRENQFVGETVRGACVVESRQSGRTLIIEDDLVLTPNAIWIRDRAQTTDGEYLYGNRLELPHRLVRVRAFECWVAVLRGASHGESGEGQSDWQFLRNVWLHDQGGSAILTTDEAAPRQIELRLRDVEWPARDRRGSLTLYVHDAGDDRATSYAWGEAGAERLGINLRWLQASCTHMPDSWGQ